jgi:uncharacterized protein
MNAAYWIQKLKLQPHPEGGYYRETFRSATKIMRAGSPEVRQACTSIYYLLEGKDFSGFHRITSDELWYFHKGEPLLIHIIDATGILITHELSDQSGGDLSVAVPGGNWFAAEIKTASSFTLVSCNVAPGFEFTEFEMAVKETLLATFPQHSEVIKRLCR